MEQALPLEPGVTLRVVHNSGDIETVLEYVNQGNFEKYADRVFVDELISGCVFDSTVQSRLA
jgi:hypothetical protein